MVKVDQAVLADPVRLKAVELSKRLLPVLPMPVDEIARLAARLTGAPMAVVTLVGSEEEFFAGTYALPETLGSRGKRLPLEYSLCKYVVSSDHLLGVEDMRASDDPELCEHLLTREYGVRAFLSVPVRDTEDRPVGSLTVLDTEVRGWTDEHSATLLEIEHLLRPPAGWTALPAAVDGLDSAALLDSVPQALLAVDANGIIVGFNRAAEDLLGFTAAEVRGCSLDDCIHPDYDHQPIGAALDRLFAAAPTRPVRRQVRLRHRDGRRLLTEVALTVVRGSAGALACVLITDLTGSKAVEERADHNASFLNALLDSLSVGVVACDAAGGLVVMNRALREVYGLPATSDLPTDYATAIGRFLYDSDNKPLPWRSAPLMRACAGEYVRDTDIFIAVPGHRNRTFSVTAQPIVTPDGRRTGAVAVSHEVTAVRRVERFRACHEAVELALKSAASIADATPSVLQAVVTTLGWSAAELYLVDEITGQLHTVGHWNGTAMDIEDFFGHTPVKGAGATGRVWKTGQPFWIREIGEATMLRSPFERERVEICLRSGIHSVLAVPVSDGRSLLGVLTCYAGAAEHHEDMLTVLLDGVAAQIGIFVALRRAEELSRQLGRMQDDFISLVGHELRTPLTAITAYAGMLADDYSEDDEGRAMVQSIERNAAELQTIVATLLDLAGLDSGHLNLNIRRVDLTTIIAECEAASHHHDVRFHTDMPDAVTIDGDPDRLRQVVQDLLDNAAKYSPGGSDVHVSLETDGQMAELCVSDEGIGTPRDERERVFDRFYRGSNVRHHGTNGSGLGLSRARTIVHLHGGTIQLLDNEPTGTVAVVRLPHEQDAALTVRRL
ncbi:PAS domain S-box-containing protein [Couchioplanes caeruleus]|uniref:histidine kinase n=2 Tax=Couchioplanes caeruleus TaxID=56438 RepID=A0A3N1GPB8_9ACTN|nr:PAS domain S-box-containing protein [Couchioplanes caeruleus]